MDIPDGIKYFKLKTLTKQSQYKFFFAKRYPFETLLKL